jgi:hypothetical protein
MAGQSRETRAVIATQLLMLATAIAAIALLAAEAHPRATDFVVGVLSGEVIGYVTLCLLDLY